MLDSLLEKGIKYLFVSNSDNLGATLDLKLLSYFAASDMSFLMEVRALFAGYSVGELCDSMGSLAKLVILSSLSVHL